MISKVTRLFYSGTRRSSSIALRHSLRTFVSTPVTLHVANQAHHSEQPNLSPPQSRRPKEEGTIASVFATLSGGSLSDALPSRFLQLKKSLVMSPEHALALQQAWKEIIAALATQTREASLHGAGMIPQVHYPGDQTVERKPAEEWIGHDNMTALRERGTIILKNVVPASVALLWKQQIREYIEKNPQTKGFPEHDRQVFELYWSKSQLAARGHTSLLKASQAILSLWNTPSQTSKSGFTDVAPLERSASLRNPLSYCDRLRIRMPGDSAFALGPHIDGGGVERWEDETFRGCWSSILEPKKDSHGALYLDWQKHDSWSLGEKAERLGARTDMYNGAGACSVFRPLQGWLSMSSTGANEGTLRVLPILKAATAYIILRPFFRPIKTLAESDNNEEAYLSVENWKFHLDDSHFDGCTLGRNIELDSTTHPHLRLDRTMTSIPRVEPGDMALWHCDVVHAVEGQHNGTFGQDSSVLYIPAIPLTKANFEYIVAQRNAFFQGIPPHDFPGGQGESQHVDRGTDQDVNNSMARRAMGLEPFTLEDGMPEAEKRLLEYCNKHI